MKGEGQVKWPRAPRGHVSTMSARREPETTTDPAAACLAAGLPSRPLTVLLCGDRDWTDGGLILRILVTLPQVAMVLHGGCRGADLLGGWAARRLGIAVEVFPADWAGEGRAAGPLRNARMLAEGRPDLVLAFHDDIGSSRGTADMIRKALVASVQVRLVSHRGIQDLSRGAVTKEAA
ncbi:MAG: DUF2493 domain-containing protein [Euryarchaeota archaeon]|nr:DUF2493 domain-containing protein [Euryarchaeota archaeon]MDE1881424.1 DUF2493 domain-containing protein [Euryarchaeota archaeon]MDE2045366.1 DUF2493 domain-containing protein [Thermoplasmata archaeon]